MKELKLLLWYVLWSVVPVVIAWAVLMISLAILVYALGFKDTGQYLFDIADLPFLLWMSLKEGT